MPYIIAVDFDGTLFTDNFPKSDQNVINKIKEFQKFGANVCLWTCRENSSLDKAVKKCKEHGLLFDAVNENFPVIKEYQKEMKVQMAFRKIFADIYVDGEKETVNLVPSDLRVLLDFARDLTAQ